MTTPHDDPQKLPRGSALAGWRGSIVPQSEHAPVQCRIANVSADVKSSLAYLDFCAFECPRCDGCPNESGSVSTLKSVEDPMNSVVVSGCLHGDLHAPS